MLTFSKPRGLAVFVLFFYSFLLLTTEKTFSQTAIQFDGSNDYVSFGQATSTLGAQSFTLECWFQRTGTGAVTTTGGTGATGGIRAIPLFTKGRGETDGSVVDANYFLGINAPTTGYPYATNILVADFEEGTGTSSPGLNHPVGGVTPIVNNVWYHGAVTFDAPNRRWRLYLNGAVEKDTVIESGTRYPQYLSIQHAGLGTAMNSSGTAEGFFAGVMDEGRIWNVARTQAEIQASMNLEITSGTGLLGRWGLNDGSGITAENSIIYDPVVNGALINGPFWTYDSLFSSTKTFQQGLNGYLGTIDTYLDGSDPTNSKGTEQVIIWDTESSGYLRYALLKFDEIFGSGAEQIPMNANVLLAKLKYNVSNVGDDAHIYEASVDWLENVTYNSFGGDAGVQSDEYGSLIAATYGSGTIGNKEIDVTLSLAAWALNPTKNKGWIFIPLNTNGVQVSSGDNATVNLRPLLTVVYNLGPVTPQLISPADGSLVSGDFPTLNVAVSDDNATNLTVRFYGRLVEEGEKFTLIGIPDTQYYTSSKNNGSPAILNSQTQWIVTNKDALNIVYCAGLGDCVDDGDLNEPPWQALDIAMGYIENPVTTNLPDGIPYGLSVGNHDQSPNGDANGTTNYYNQYFGSSRFSGRDYYGGNYGSDNDNHYDLFSAGGMDFIAIHFEYDTSPDAAVTSWAENLLQTYINRRAIIVSHHIINSGNPGSFSTQGQAFYDAFKDNPNVFLMLCGHVTEEGRRTDTFNGNTIHSIMSDYQARTNGGNGWFRIMEFDPPNNIINIKTYSPYLSQYETDANSQFSLNYDMESGTQLPFSLLNTQNSVSNPGNASFYWSGLEGDKTYEWYVTIEDGDGYITNGPVWNFKTNAVLPVELSSFTAKVKENNVLLNWRTETEVSNYGFEIERSVRRDDWGKIGFVSGHGNTNSPKEYVFTDENPVGGSSFKYRLKQIDTDGIYTYSDIVEVDMIPNEYVLYQNYPNPFNPTTTIQYNLKADNWVNISIYSVLGEKVSTLIDAKMEKGFHEVKLNASNLASGVYIYKLNVGNNGSDYIGIKKMMVVK